MLTALLAMIVAFFTLKSLSAFIVRGALSLMGHGVVGVAKTVGHAGETVGDRVGTRFSEGLKGLGKSKLAKQAAKATAMNGFAGNIEDFGVIVFGSEKKMVEVASTKLVEALQEKLSTDEGRAEVAKRLAKISQESN